MIKNRDIIVVGIQSWDIQIGSNCKNIALEFSKNNRVLYVNSPISRLSAYRDKALAAKYKTKDRSLNLNEVSKNLWSYYPKNKIESISSLSFNLLFDILNKRNNRIFAIDIKKAIEALKFSNYILFCDSDMFRSYYLKELLNPDMYIYYTRDNLLAIKFWQTQGKRIEPAHMAKADLVLANSTYLANIAKKNNPQSYFVGQGCDLSTFKSETKRTLPQDIVNIPKPVIGYIGTLVTLRLDIELIKHIALNKPEWNIVLVGPEDEAFQASDLHQLKNVWFLGSKPESELPQYLQAFTVAINPQIFNELTIGNYPRKIDEYLAMGKPTVASKTEAMSFFGEHVSLAGNKEEWVSCIESEINNNTPEKETERTKFAGEHTWENNVNEIYKRIEQISGQK